MPKQARIESDLIDAPAATVLQLAADYRRAAAVVVAELKAQTAESDLLGAWRSGRIKQRGRISAIKGRYCFHGIGCHFQIGSREIDINFGPEGRHDGFDAWRLSMYAASAFEWTGLSKEMIEEGLRSLVEAGVMYPLAGDFGSSLLYLREPVRLAAG